MLTHLRRLRRDERGMSLVFVGLGFMAFLTATTLAIDVGMFMVARSQAQNSADSGALAGAVAIVFNSYTDRSSSGPAVQSAVNAATSNQVISAPVSVLPSDVTFPNDANGQPTLVSVSVYRTAQRSNPVPTLMGTVFGLSNVDILATATAQAAPANAETCVMPFTIPDKWIEKQCPPELCDYYQWDPSDTFELFANNNTGAPLANPDVYIPADQPGYTGYDATRDKGLELVLKANNTTKVDPSFYNPWALPGGTGANWYRANIASCNPDVVPIGDPMTAEPGNMEGPTLQGTAGRVAQDPGAYWDTSRNCVLGSAFSPPGTCASASPRIVTIPVYDPVYWANGIHEGRNVSLKLANYVGFFIEGVLGNQVMGRVTPILGVLDNSAGPAPPGAFPRVIRLVQ